MATNGKAPTTKVGQVAQLAVDQNGRVTADATKSTPQPGVKPVEKPIKTPIGVPIGKPEPLQAETLKVGMRLRLFDKSISGVVVVVKVYPKGHKSLSETEGSVYLEGITDHSWSGLYFSDTLKDYKATRIYTEKE